MSLGSSNKTSIDTSFSRSKRLLTPKDYKTVFDNVSFKIHQPHLFCLVAVQSSNPMLAVSYNHSRLGLAVSKAKNKKAPERNRIKRLVREYFRLHQHELLETVDIVFMTKKNTEAVSNAELKAELEKSWYFINKKLKNIK